MIESNPQNVFNIIVALLSGLIVFKTAWQFLISPILCIETKQNKEFRLFKGEIKEDLCDIKDRLDKTEKVRKEGRELQELILQGVTASLNSLKRAGENGPVTSTLEQIDEYKITKAII